MFGRNKSLTPIDITHKTLKTWWGGTKMVSTSKAKQKKMKAEILRKNPRAVVLDNREKKRRENEHVLSWIDELAVFNAIFED